MKTLFVCLSILFCQILIADDDCKAPSLSILLTNDDGVTTVGIQEMHRALMDAGHKVQRIAPSRNFSGSGASLTFRGVTVEDLSSDEFPDVYAVGGSPATSVILGATAIYQPDESLNLIVSGINDGPNIGPAPTVSGTVGAVLTGLNLLHPSVPGIAISTSPVNEDSESLEYRQHFANVARFVTRIVGVIGCDDSSLLNSNQALHINYPPLAPDDIQGVRLAEQGHLVAPRVAYAKNEDGKYDIRALSGAAVASENADTSLFNIGFVTIVPIDGEYTTTPQFDTEQILSIDP